MKRLWHNIILPFLAFLVFLLMISICGVIEAEGQAPYDRDFIVVRAVPVTPTDLLATLSAAQPGDQLVMADGNYSGNLIMDRVNVMLFCPGHCVLNGTVKLQAQNVWLVGLEIIANAGNFVEMQATDAAVMGCLIHGQGALGTVGILATNWPNQLIAFNTIFDVQHDIYIQNTAPSAKWIVGNALLDVIASSNSRTVHAYTESANKGEKMYLYDNIATNGQFLVGGQMNSTPYLLIEVIGNVQYKADFNGGYKRPIQLRYEKNKLFRSKVDLALLWGEGEQQYIAGSLDSSGNPYCTGESCLFECSTIKENVFYNPNNTQLAIKTAAYYPPGTRNEGLPKLRSCDSSDLNYYHGGFKNALHANNTNDVVIQPLSFWHTKTQNAGNKLDATSTSSPSAPTNGYKLIQNEWDPGKALLAVWAFDGAATVSVTLPNSGNVYQAKNPHGTPVGAFNSGLNSIPVAGEFSVYAVKYSGPPPPQCKPDEVDSRLAEAMTILNDPNLTATKARRQAKKKVLEARALLIPCL